jgi:hypothetical protein
MKLPQILQPQPQPQPHLPFNLLNGKKTLMNAENISMVNIREHFTKKRVISAFISLIEQLRHYFFGLILNHFSQK